MPPERPAPSNRFRGLIQGSRPLACLAYLGKAAWASLRLRSGSIDTSSGTLHGTLDVAASVQYIQDVFDDYRALAGVPAFHGRVAELGPGDNAGVGLLFLQDGCTAVDLVDRFYSRRDPRQQTLIYEALGARHPWIRARLAGEDQAREPEVPGLCRHYGEAAAAETFFRDHGPYDFIVSRAVLEHAYDPGLALRAMAGALAPGGCLLHKVDLRDHTLFSSHAHELAWLETPETLHRWMTRPQGWPNRVLAHHYRAILAGTGLQAQILVTSLAGVGDILPYQPYEAIPTELRARALEAVDRVGSRLSRSLMEASREDLSINGIFIVARKV